MSLTKDEFLRFARDVKSGMSDSDLREKYGLSERTLVLHKMAIHDAKRHLRSHQPRPKRRINADEVVNDVRSGMDEDAMMKKYDLTARELQKLFRKIIAAGFMSPRELADRLKITESQIRQAFADASEATGELTRGQLIKPPEK